MVDVDETNKVPLGKSYEELLKTSIEKEEELRALKQKLQLSDNEVQRLRNVLAESECAIQLAENLKRELDTVKKDLEIKKTDLELERKKVFKLQKQAAELETHVPDCHHTFAELMDELEVAKVSLKRSDEEIVRLNLVRLNQEAGLERRHILEMNERIAWYEARLSELDVEVQFLKVQMSAKQEQFSFESDNLILSEDVISLNSNINDLESESKSFENKLWQCEAEKLEMHESHVAQEKVIQDEKNRLRGELHTRRFELEALNKEFDRQKNKYDMLMVEKDELNAKAQKLLADVSSRDDSVLDLQRLLNQLRAEQEGTENTVKELKLQVDELQKEVCRKKAEISDGAEAKREAIRQLCSSVEHYRSCYQELRQGITSNKRNALAAS